MSKNNVSSFIVLTGAYGNIGDALIRRRVLHWIDTLSDVHAYIGTADENWIEQLDFRVNKTKIYRRGDFATWIWKAISGRGKRVLVLDPGEVDLSRAALKSELVIGILTLLFRVRGGTVIRPPRSVVVKSRTLLKLHRFVSKMSTLAFWREQRTSKIMGAGFSVPDVAFQEFVEDVGDFSKRKNIFISMRASRPGLPNVTLEAIKEFADSNDFNLVLGSQVRADEPRTMELAESLDAQYLSWGDRSDKEQEAKLREVYLQSCLVITDRLHVAILASCLGAVPTEIAFRPNGKIERHFSQIGIDGISLDASDSKQDSILRFLEKNLSRSVELRELLETARNNVGEVQARIVSEIDRH